MLCRIKIISVLVSEQVNVERLKAERENDYKIIVHRKHWPIVVEVINQRYVPPKRVAYATFHHKKQGSIALWMPKAICPKVLPVECELEALESQSISGITIHYRESEILKIEHDHEADC